MGTLYFSQCVIPRINTAFLHGGQKGLIKDCFREEKKPVFCTLHMKQKLPITVFTVTNRYWFLFSCLPLLWMNIDADVLCGIWKRWERKNKIFI